LLICLATGALSTATQAGGTVTFSLSSPSANCTVHPGASVQWSISFTVSGGDNLGLALAAVNLLQDPANPALFDIPVGTRPQGMQDFDRPDGISNPGPGGVGSAYGGTPVGATGAKNLVQIGGAQNTFGVAGDGIGLDFDVRGGVGQGGPEILAAGSFPAPATFGVYIFSLGSPIANTLNEIVPPPDFSPVSAATASISSGSVTFTVALHATGDMNCDCVVNFDDINPFVLALSDPAAYSAAYPDCDILNADCDHDGDVDFDDMNPFIALLSG
jgi:hypothetical protein